MIQFNQVGDKMRTLQQTPKKKKNSEDHKGLHTKSIFHQTGGSERNGTNFRILYMACKT